MNHDGRPVVFDLDGTLVRLAGDWDAVAAAARAALHERGVDPPRDLWTILEVADEAGHRPAVERVIARHEREGARRSERLPAADTVPGSSGGPIAVGVCTLNCEEAARLALETHGIAGVDRDAVVGRDTVATEKPDPEPLLETIRRLDADPASALFVGDGERDERTADRAGVDFLYVSEWLRAYR